MLVIVIEINCTIIVIILFFTMDEHSLRIYCALEHMKQVSVVQVDP
jgi:hypothetical protein